MRHIIAITLLSSLALTGCKKKEEAAGGGSAAAKPAEPKAACAAGMWKAPSGAFCINAHGYTAGEEKDDDPNMQIDFKSVAADGSDEKYFHVWYRKSADPSEFTTMAANAETDVKAAKEEGRGDFAGGNGKYFLWNRDTTHKLFVVIKGKKNAFVCEASNYNAPVDPGALEACKSLTPID